MAKIILKDVVSHYEPTNVEKSLIQKNIKRNATEWWIMAGLMNLIFGFSAFMIFTNGEISFTDEMAIVLYIFIGFIALIDALLFYKIAQSMSVNVNKCNFSKGLLTKTWRETHHRSDSSSSSISYYGDITLDNGYVIDSVQIDSDLYQKDLHTVVVTYYKNKIINVIERP